MTFHCPVLGCVYRRTRRQPDARSFASQAGLDAHLRDAHPRHYVCQRCGSAPLLSRRSRHEDEAHGHCHFNRFRFRQQLAPRQEREAQEHDEQPAGADVGAAAAVDEFPDAGDALQEEHDDDIEGVGDRQELEFAEVRGVEPRGEGRARFE